MAQTKDRKDPYAHLPGNPWSRMRPLRRVLDDEHHLVGIEAQLFFDSLMRSARELVKGSASKGKRAAGNALEPLVHGLADEAAGCHSIIFHETRYAPAPWHKPKGDVGSFRSLLVRTCDVRDLANDIACAMGEQVTHDTPLSVSWPLIDALLPGAMDDGRQAMMLTSLCLTATRRRIEVHCRDFPIAIDRHAAYRYRGRCPEGREAPAFKGLASLLLPHLPLAGLMGVVLGQVGQASFILPAGDGLVMGVRVPVRPRERREREGEFNQSRVSSSGDGSFRLLRGADHGSLAVDGVYSLCYANTFVPGAMLTGQQPYLRDSLAFIGLRHHDVLQRLLLSQMEPFVPLLDEDGAFSAVVAEVEELVSSPEWEECVRFRDHEVFETEEDLRPLGVSL